MRRLRSMKVSRFCRRIQPSNARRELLVATACLGSRAGIGRGLWFRNAQVTVIAPTGTIGLVMDCDTTGIEPDFALVKFKKLAGGGYFKIINQSLPPALAALGVYRGADPGHRRLLRGASNLQGSALHQS